jgi:hypothetical protein
MAVALSLVPYIHVADCARSIKFYAKLGFEAGETAEDDGVIHWAWLETEEGAEMMVAVAEEPVDPRKQAVLFYLYVDDVLGFHADLKRRGVAAGDINTPDWAPRGEFRVEDPDGYVVMIRHED